MKKLYQEYPFRSAKKFIPIAIRHGFTRAQAEAFLSSLPHDVKYSRQEHMMLPIYSDHPNAFQFDTLVQTKKASPRYFLVFVNVNSRKVFAYPMSAKDSKSVLNALKLFVKENPLCKALTSDQDKAFLSPSVTSFLIQHQISHQTTFRNDHNRLGIINRAIKTLRDVNQERDFSTESMRHAIHAYNNTIHSSTGKEPDEFGLDDEYKYIHRKQMETDVLKNRYVLQEGCHVRVMQDRNTIGKKRSNLTPDAFIVDGRLGNKYIIRAKDKSVSEYPRYRLVRDDNAKLAKTLSSGRNVVEKIRSYRKGRYEVQFNDGTVSSLPVSYLREGRPTHLSPEEIKFWRAKTLPPELTPFLHR